MSSRSQFDQRIEEIRSSVIRMGAEASEMARHAVEAACNGDLEVARQVMLTDDVVDDLEKLIYQQTVTLVMREAPVANDLRFLVATLGVVGEIEKAGDDAVKLARRVNKLSAQFPAEFKKALTDLGVQSRSLFAGAMRLYSEYSPELAKQIVRGDKEVDSAYSSARNRLIDVIASNPGASESLIRTIECFHALEHVADHAVEIARRMRLLFGHLEVAPVHDSGPDSPKNVQPPDSST